MAARLARQRQQRSMLRTAALPMDSATEGSATPAALGSELHILRAEVANSGATISRLQTQLKQSEEEMVVMGQETARMAEELRMLSARAEAQRAADAAPAAAVPAPAADIRPSGDGPMSVAIQLGDDDDISVSVSIACDDSGDPSAAISLS